MKIEVIIDTLGHDCERVAVGTIMDLEPVAARALLDAGAAKKASAKSKSAGKAADSNSESEAE